MADHFDVRYERWLASLEAGPCIHVAPGHAGPCALCGLVRHSNATAAAAAS